MERVELSKAEDEAKDALIDVMLKNNLNRYEMPDGKVIIVTNKSGVKVKKPKKTEETEEGGED